MKINIFIFTLSMLMSLNNYAYSADIEDIQSIQKQTKIAVIDIKDVISVSAEVKRLQEEQTKNAIQLSEKINKGEINSAELEQLKEKITAEYQAKLQKVDENIRKTISVVADEKEISIVLTKDSVIHKNNDIIDITEDVKNRVK